MLNTVAYGDVEVEADECVSSPADAIDEGSQRQEQGHVLHALCLDHHFLMTQEEKLNTHTEEKTLISMKKRKIKKIPHWYGEGINAMIIKQSFVHMYYIYIHQQS